VGPDVEVVHQEDVDPPGAEALQAVLERTHHAVVGVVVDLGKRQAVLELAVVEGRRIARLEQAPDLGREHEIGARLAAQRLAEAMLRQAEAVQRRGVEIADAGIMAGLERGPRLGIRERPVHVAERRPAAAHDRDLDPRAAEHPPVAWFHQPASPTCAQKVPPPAAKGEAAASILEGARQSAWRSDRIGRLARRPC
jgi:hypothetical protein